MPSQLVDALDRLAACASEGSGLMAIVELPPSGPQHAEDYPHAVNVGPIGRLGRYTATHFRVVLVGWLVVALGLGFFAPRVETALSGAGWETTGLAVGAGPAADRQELPRPLELRADDRRLLADADDQRPRLQEHDRARSRRRCAPTAPYAASSPHHPASRSPATGTPRSCRPAPPGAPTGWSRRPTRSKGKLAAPLRRRRAGPPDRRVGDVV